MNTLSRTILALGVAVLAASYSQAAVKITALQMISTDANGKIQGVGAHRFKQRTTVVSLAFISSIVTT